MKKMSLIFMSILLVACMAGSAMAMPAKMKLLDMDNKEILGPIIIPSDGTAKTVKVNVYDIAYSSFDERYIPSGNHPRTFSVKVLSGPITIEGISIDGGSNWITPASGQNIVSIGYNAIASNSYTFLVKLSGSDSGNIKVKDISTDPIDGTSAEFNNAEFDEAVETYELGIPEFPTVALPIASVIGLLFVFGRKKEGL